MDRTEKRRRFIIDFLYLAIVLGIAIFFCRYAINAVMPFVVALVVALLLRPLIRFLSEKCRVQKNVAAIVVVILFYALIGFLLTILGIKIFSVGKDFFARLPAVYRSTIEPWLYNAFNSAESLAESIDPVAASTYDILAARVTSSLGNAVGELSGRVLGGAANFTLKAPKFLLYALFAIIATVFFSIDLPLMKRFLYGQFSEKNQQFLHDVRSHLGTTLGRYVRSYSLILGITFLELSLGLSILKIDGAVGIAALTAALDILPVVGSGTVLLPWTVVCLIQQNYPLALGIFIVYIIILVVRNIIEPKIVGDRVGLHPLLTLMSMLVGTYVFGPIGLLGLPVALALIKSLNDDGIIHVFNNVEAPPDEPEKPSAPKRPFRKKTKKSEDGTHVE